MSAAPTPISKAPRPAEVDERAEKFHKLEADLATKVEECSKLKKDIAARELDLIELVKAFGGPHCTKSKILHGIVWEMVATFSQYTVLDSLAIERFRKALAEAGQTRLIKKMFKQDVRWTFDAASTAEIVKTERLSSKLMALLLQCTVSQDKKPSLDVRPKKPV
jgi:hypothetical protein